MTELTNKFPSNFKVFNAVPDNSTWQAFPNKNLLMGYTGKTTLEEGHVTAPYIPEGFPWGPELVQRELFDGWSHNVKP